MGLQHIITTAMVIGFLETLLWTIDFVNYNYNGLVLDGINMCGALLNAAKLTIVRTLLLLVAIGYSITRPTLSTKTTIFVVTLTLFYFVTSATNQYVWVGRTIGLDIPTPFRYVVIVILVILNFGYILWISHALYINMTFLKARAHLEKLELYKVLASSLLVFLSLCLLCFTLEFTFGLVDYDDDLWSFWWIWDAFWEFGYLLLILLIAFLWRPNPNNKRYAFSSQASYVNDEDAEEFSSDVRLSGGQSTGEEKDSTNEEEAGQEGYDSENSLEQLAL